MSDTKEKLSDKQLRIVQFVAGILSAAALIGSIFFAPELTKVSSLLQYLFLVIFLIVTIGRRKIETKYRLRLNFFGLVLIDGILAGVMLLTINAFYLSADAAAQIELDNIWKILIIVAIALVLLIPGILLPLLRYDKRKKAGTLMPIRLPEKPQEETAAQEPVDDRPLTIEQQIAEMTKDLDNDSGEGQDKQ